MVETREQAVGFACKRAGISMSSGGGAPGMKVTIQSQWNGTTCGAVLQDSAGLSESALMIDLTLNLEKSRAS